MRYIYGISTVYETTIRRKIAINVIYILQTEYNEQQTTTQMVVDENIHNKIEAKEKTL